MMDERVDDTPPRNWDILADALDACSPWIATKEGWEAAAVLRAQAAEIEKLRAAVALALTLLADNHAYSDHSIYEESERFLRTSDAIAALTDVLSKCSPAAAHESKNENNTK